VLLADNQLKSLLMLRIFAKIKKLFFLLCLLPLAAPLCSAAEQLDTTKYITIDEIKPGMQAYCLTAYKGTHVEKFNMEVLDVVRNVTPGRDARLYRRQTGRSTCFRLDLQQRPPLRRNSYRIYAESN